MVILFYILLGVYIIAINFYAFTLLKTQKNTEESCQNARVRDGKLLITALLGGSIGIIISAIVLNHRKKSMFIMVIMPVLAVLNGYLIYLVISSGVNYFLLTPNSEENLRYLTLFILS